MALSIFGADDYISAHVIDVEDWEDSDESRKQRLLNVASRTITNRFKSYVIPDEAVYEFVPKLAAIFNDTYKMQQYGVQSFSVKGISFSFRNTEIDLAAIIPPSSLTIISAANGGVDSAKRRIGRSIR